MSRRGVALSRLALVLALFTSWVERVQAAPEDGLLGQAQLAIQQVEAEAVAIAKGKPSKRQTADERLAIGEMLLRNRDPETAIAMFHQVLELYQQGKASEGAHADALFLLGESYFQTRQLPSARRHFRVIAERGAEEAFAGHAGRALSRLVDVAMRRGFEDELDVVFAHLARLGQKDPSGALSYAMGKACVAAERYPEALRALRSVPESSALRFQAEYLQGVVFLRQAQSDKAPKPNPEDLAKVPDSAQPFTLSILQFQRITRLAPETPEALHVVDLSWLALGRIFYETENGLDAVDAYARVGRDSPEFPTSLFELAWVYVSLEDYEQARNTLEVLEVVAPESLGLAEGALLRADLMLRAKEYPEALRAYQNVRQRFGPAHEQLSEFLTRERDPAVYYGKLASWRDELQTRSDLPRAVMEWVRELEDERAFALIDDVGRSQQLLRESRRMAQTMAGVLEAPTKARAFPELREQIQRTLALANRLSRSKRELVLGLEALGTPPSAELAQVRRERAGLMQAIGALPVEVRDFLGRESSAHREWDSVSQRLQELSLETDQMRATVNGIRRILREAKDFGLALSEARRAQLTEELLTTEREIDNYQGRIREQREALERGRLQVGFGGPDYEKDHKARRRFDQLVNREFDLASRGQAGDSAAEFARRALTLIGRADRARDRLEQLNADYEQNVAAQAQQMLDLVRQEAIQVDRGSTALDGLDQQARSLFGELARNSFVVVQEKLGSLLLRADIGVAQQAWEVRQAHFDSVRELQRLRARNEQELTEEFQEVSHAGGEP